MAIQTNNLPRIANYIPPNPDDKLNVQPAAVSPPTMNPAVAASIQQSQATVPASNWRNAIFGVPGSGNAGDYAAQGNYPAAIGSALRQGATNTFNAINPLVPARDLVQMVAPAVRDFAGGLSGYTPQQMQSLAQAAQTPQASVQTFVQPRQGMAITSPQDGEAAITKGYTLVSDGKGGIRAVTPQPSPAFIPLSQQQQAQAPPALGDMVYQGHGIYTRQAADGGPGNATGAAAMTPRDTLADAMGFTPAQSRVFARLPMAQFSQILNPLQARETNAPKQQYLDLINQEGRQALATAQAKYGANSTQAMNAYMDHLNRIREMALTTTADMIHPPMLQDQQ